MTEEKDSVLVVDDDRTIRTMLVQRLIKGGIATEQAEDGITALDMLKAKPFDVVVLDILMPRMNGYDVLENIKSDSSLQRTAVIMMSTLSEMDGVIRCLEAGAEDYLPKPLDYLLLLSRVNAILLRKRFAQLKNEYEEHVSSLLRAASAIEDGTFHPEALEEIASRPDALGQLAQEFQHIAELVVRQSNS